MPPPQEIAGLIKGLLTIGFPYFFLGGESQKRLGGGFKDLFIFTPKIGEDFHLDEHIFKGLVQPPTRRCRIPPET